MKISFSAVICLVYMSLNIVVGYILDMDKPCAARNIPGQSVICVCNVSYCDTITRIKPKFGTYVAYTTSEGGLRFRKTFGNVLSSFRNGDTNAPILELHPQKLYQVIYGFGGSVSDSTALNWKSLKNPHLRQHLVNSYCSRLGLEYNMFRLPMAVTDFSIRPYTYHDSPGDFRLTNFSLAQEDYKYKIPFIKACMDVATSPIQIVGSMWSPPTWMKTINKLGTGHLKEEHYQTLANYYIKFLEKYNESGVPIWAITTANEPISSLIFDSIPITTQWTVSSMAKWITNNLGPSIRNSAFRDVKILGCDDMRFTIPMWFSAMVLQYPATLEYLDGISLHSYFDFLTPGSQITVALKDYPDKFVLSTEACAGIGVTGDNKVVLGSWSSAEIYAIDIIDNLNHKVSGWIDWNMCLNEIGGPNWAQSSADSPLIVSAEKQEFYKQPMFYVMGHFSKFVPRGSRRIKVTGRGNISDVDNVAFLTPENTIVVVLFNKVKRRDVVIKLGSQSFVINVEPKSITTIELSYNSISKTFV